MNEDLFPKLNANNHRITSSANPDYNCIAWAAGDMIRWWQPGVYWPLSAPQDDAGVGILERAFTFLGFEFCVDGILEQGYEKVAFFGNNMFYTHAARQLPNGKWTSKLGTMEDIEHDLADDVAGDLYGEVVQFMKRAIPA